MSNKEPSEEYIEYICNLYGDIYDDRIEDSKPPAAGDDFRVPGKDWMPGEMAAHKSLAVFKQELQDQGINLSTSKIRKILITGGCWSTERSRQIADLFDHYTSSKADGGYELSGSQASKRIADELDVSLVTVNVNLPYQNVVYKLEKRSKNAVRCARYKERKRLENLNGR